MKKNKKFLPFFKKKWIALIAFYELCNNAYSQASVSTLSGDVTTQMSAAQSMVITVCNTVSIIGACIGLTIALYKLVNKKEGQDNSAVIITVLTTVVGFAILRLVIVWVKNANIFS